MLEKGDTMPADRALNLFSADLLSGDLDWKWRFTRFPWHGTFLSCLTAFLGLLLPIGAGAAPPQQPNVIIVLADDLGWGDLSCYRQSGETGEQAETPQLDAMADFLDPAAPSLPRQLRAAGYATAHVGKWHLGGGRDVADAPQFAAYGYDMGVGTWESPAPHPSLTAENWVWSASDPVKRWNRTGWMVDQTLQFLADHGDRPCFVNLWLNDPHTPWVPSESDQQTGSGGLTRGAGDSPEKLWRKSVP